MSWHIYICKKCGHVQVKENRTSKLKATFKCQRCEKTSKIITQTKSGRFQLNSYGPFDNPITASLVCKKVKMHMNTGNTEIWNIDLEFEKV